MVKSCLIRINEHTKHQLDMFRQQDGFKLSYNSIIKELMSDTNYIEIGKAFFKSIETRNCFHSEDDLIKLKKVVEETIKRNKKTYNISSNDNNELDAMGEKLKELISGYDEDIENFFKKYKKD